jgi:hypothetical protein
VNSVVITPAPDFNLTTLASLKLEFDIQTTDTDVYLQRQILRASGAVASYCRRVFALQTYQDTYKCEWAVWMPRSLQLVHYPVVADTVEIVRDGTTLVDGDDYDIDLDVGIVRNISLGQEVQVTYDAGWLLPGWLAPSGSMAQTLPPEVEQAVLLQILAARQIGRISFTDRDPFLRAETVEGVGQLQYSTTAIGASVGASGLGGLSGPARDLLAPYTVPVCA